eukprot:727849-Prymnesium_polylepis.1
MAPCVAESTTRHAITPLKLTAYRIGAAVTRCTQRESMPSMENFGRLVACLACGTRSGLGAM